MQVKTKKYQLDKKEYISLGMKRVMKKWWWAFLIPAVMILVGAFLPEGWSLGVIITAVVITILYVLFWGIQFSGAPHLEQMKPMFQKMAYQIDSKQLTMLVGPNQGMMIPWAQIERIEFLPDAFVLYIGVAQIIHLPHSIFTNQHGLKFTESILKREAEKRK